MPPRMLAVIAALALTAGCTAAQRQAMNQAQQQRESQQRLQASILVTPGDLSGQKYQILGPVEWPGAGNIMLLGSRCDPDRLKQDAIAAWGTRVNAIIGYHEWRDTSQFRCGGTAVQFISEAGASVQPPSVSMASSFRVASVDLGNSIAADKTIPQPTTTFSPSDTIYASVTTEGAAPSVTLKARWTYEGGQLVNETTQRIAPTGTANTEFHIAKPNAWPAGAYAVEISVDGAVVSTKEFTVAH